ncbi:MAG: S1 RNA-binding domain-containing protein [Lachnospiraceae bacterium]|nr:S1 RNA-binding domain-containing protein [Lachnospiraceae bacterium]
MESMKDYEKELERSFRKIEEGDILTGTVIAVSEDEVTLDLAYYTQGIIKAENLSNDPGFSVFEDVKVGDEIEATVIKVDDGRGNIELSKKEANDVLAWDKLAEMMENETVVNVKITESVNAGVVTFLEGIRAFIPASQISSNYVENTDDWIGKKIDVKVITVDREKKKLVLSGKAVAREREAEERNHKISMLVPGTVMEGKVETIKPYGAFISLGDGLDGLVHISQISQKRISTPYEVLKEGQSVKVKILNTNDGKISLSMKALEEEMVDTSDSGVGEDISEYVSKEEVSTSLGSLLAGIKLD